MASTNNKVADIAINQIKSALPQTLEDVYNFKYDYFDSDKYGDIPYDLIDDPLVRSFLYEKQKTVGDADAQNAFAQRLNEYLVGEQNYDRSKASNQTALLQAAGMSRAAALSTLQQGAESTTSLTPIQSDIEGHKRQRVQNILDIIQGASALAGQIASFTEQAYDIKAKSIANDMMQHQDDLLQMQIEGMQDAAAFVQAAANADVSDPSGRKISHLPIAEQIDYFAKQGGMQPKDPGYNASAFYYAQDPSFKRGLTNPFFWATVSNQLQRNNEALASIFSPANAEALGSQLRAATAYTQTQQVTEQLRSRILGVESFIAESNQQLRNELEQIRNICQTNQLAFDNERALKMLDRAETFTNLDYYTADYEVQRLCMLRTPEMFSRMRDELASSLDYNIINYRYQSSLQSMKSGVLYSMMLDENPQGRTDLLNWTRACLQFQELGYDRKTSNNTNIARTIFGGISTATLLGAFGFKILGNMAPSAYAGYTASATAGASAGATKLGSLASGAGMGTILSLPLLFQGDSGSSQFYKTQSNTLLEGGSNDRNPINSSMYDPSFYFKK